MDGRRLLESVDFQQGTVTVEGKTYEMLDMEFPTVDPKDPLKLTREEEELVHTLRLSFKHSQLLHKHVKFLYSHGAMYKTCNQKLLYHGCIPMKKDGSFDELEFFGIPYKGKSLMDMIDKIVQSAYFLPDSSPDKEMARDFMWYLWCGEKSPLYGKDKMTTFEHYFIAEKNTHKEVMNPYYQLSVKEEHCDRILEEFGLPTRNSHIINGHVPVKIKDGETPVKAVHHRRRSFQGIPEQDGHCRVHSDPQFQAFGFSGAQTLLSGKGEHAQGDDRGEDEAADHGGGHGPGQGADRED